MSGVEIVEEITRETGERWKPSPGSIYPLLAQLQDKGYTEELPIEESGMKRYALNEEGGKFFKREIKSGQKFFEKLEYLAPMLLEGFQFGINDEGLSEVRKSARRSAKTFIDLRAEIKDNFTKQEAEEITQIMNDCTTRLKKVAEKIRARKAS
jgi:DNA-binding PadR family transcriptional regulator